MIRRLTEEPVVVHLDPEKNPVDRVQCAHAEFSGCAKEPSVMESGD